MRTKEITIGEHKFKIKELSWDDQLDLSEMSKFTWREYMKKCIVTDENVDDLFKTISKVVGNKLLEEMQELNAGQENEDFQESNQETKEPTQNTG